MWIIIFNFYGITVKTISSTQAQKSFGDLLMHVSREPIAIKKHDKEVAILISSYDFHKLIESINEKNSKKKLSDFIGKGKNSGRFSSVEKVDEFISNNRETWEI